MKKADLSFIINSIKLILLCGVDFATKKRFLRFLSCDSREESMINVAIVDDDEKVVDMLRSYLERFSKENDIEFQAESFGCAVDFLSAFTDRYDIVFLDIELPDMNGIDAARKMREIDGTVALIFVTNMRQYAINGYEVNADDFIVKPVPYFDFSLKLSRVLKKIGVREVPKIAIKNEGMTRYIAINTIRYVEVFRHRLVYHTCDGSIEARGSLNKIEPLLTANNFERCNSCYLVNLKYVMGIEGYTLFVGYGQNSKKMDELSVSHPRKKDFIAALNKYLGVNT